MTRTNKSSLWLAVVMGSGLCAVSATLAAGLEDKDTSAHAEASAKFDLGKAEGRTSVAVGGSMAATEPALAAPSEATIAAAKPAVPAAKSGSYELELSRDKTLSRFFARQNDGLLKKLGKSIMSLIAGPVFGFLTGLEVAKEAGKGRGIIAGTIMGALLTPLAIVGGAIMGGFGLIGGGLPPIGPFE